jgi:hypothetical protein
MLSSNKKQENAQKNKKNAVKFLYLAEKQYLCSPKMKKQENRDKKLQVKH